MARKSKKSRRKHQPPCDPSVPKLRFKDEDYIQKTIDGQAIAPDDFMEEDEMEEDFREVDRFAAYNFGD